MNISVDVCKMCVDVCVCVCEYMYVYVCEMCVYIYECWSLEALKLPYSPDANCKESPCGLSPKEFICKAVSRPYSAAFSPLRYFFNQNGPRTVFQATNPGRHRCQLRSIYLKGG